MTSVPPPLTMIEPVHIVTTSSYRETGQASPNDPVISPTVPRETSGGVQEINGGDDSLDHDYMDYGRFEKPSPAAEAVLKVKEKIVKRHEQEKSGHILEWID